MLTLTEELMLLMFDPKSRTFPKSSVHAHAVINSAILVELSIAGRVHTNIKGELNVSDYSLISDPILSDAAQLIQRQKRKFPVAYWTLQLMRLNRLFDRIILRLIEKGAIRKTVEWKWCIPFTRYHLTNPGVIELLKQKIEITENALRNERIAAMISLVVGGKEVMGYLFQKNQWQELQQRFSALLRDHPIPNTVKNILFNSRSNDELLTLILLSTAGTSADAGEGDGGGSDGGD